MDGRCSPPTWVIDVDGLRGDQLPDRITLPTFGSDDSGATVLRDVERWITSKPLRRLVEAYGGDPGDNTDVDKQLEHLLEFSAAHWDFRGGRERNEAVEPDIPADTGELITRCAFELGLSGNTWPRWKDYDHVIVLGGLARTCLARTRHAAELLRRGITAAEVTGIGGFRRLTPGELENASELSLSACRYEVDALTAGLRRAFDVKDSGDTETAGDPVTDPNRSWSVTTLASTDRVRLRAIAGPSSRPEMRRADTADTIGFWSAHVASPYDKRVLVVTSPIYVPFQHCDAIRMIGLPFGSRVDTVGLRPEWLPSVLRPEPANPARYLQEIRSTLWSMRRLVTDINEA